MGEVNESAIGQVSGKVGGHTLKRRYDKTIIYENCHDFHKNESEASKAVRDKMAPMVSFARNVRAFPELEEIWAKATNIKGKAPFYKIEKLNWPLLNPSRPTINNRIIPLNGFSCLVNSLAFDHTGIRMEIRPADLNQDIIPYIKYYSALFVICLYEPVDGEAEYFTMQRSRAELTDCQPEKSTMIDIQFNEEQGKVVDAYKNWVLYFVLIIKDGAEKVIGNSMDFASEFEFSLSENSGVIPSTERKLKIKLKLSEYWMKNMQPTKFMLTQNYYKNKDQEDIFEFAVNDWEETLFWIMSLGNGVEVLEPWDLRAKVIKLAEDLLGNYKRD